LGTATTNLRIDSEFIPSLLAVPLFSCHPHPFRRQRGSFLRLARNTNSQSRVFPHPQPWLASVLNAPGASSPWAVLEAAVSSFDWRSTNDKTRAWRNWCFKRREAEGAWLNTLTILKRAACPHSNPSFLSSSNSQGKVAESVRRERSDLHNSDSTNSRVGGSKNRPNGRGGSRATLLSFAVFRCVLFRVSFSPVSAAAATLTSRSSRHYPPPA